MNNVQALPGAFPLHQDRDFLSEREWVCLQLICYSQKTLADADASELSSATAGQISVERAGEIISTAKIAGFDGLGSWIARLMVEAGLDEDTVRRLPATDIMGRVNEKSGYPLCNPATARALAGLQAIWAGRKAAARN